jgi:beta-1,4-glucosyltransferase
MTRDLRKLSIAGYGITCCTADELAALLVERIDAKSRTSVFFANIHFIASCQHIRNEFDTADTLILNDGIGPDLAARLLLGERFPENMNGTDLIPWFLNQVRLKTFLLGGTPESAGRAANFLPNITGWIDGYEGLKSPDLIRRIQSHYPDALLVGLGNPIQEEWILKHRSELDIPLVFAVGGLFDYLSGAKARAPKAMRRARLEWLYRWAKEPRRMTMRNTIGPAKFAWECWVNRKAD